MLRRVIDIYFNTGEDMKKQDFLCGLKESDITDYDLYINRKKFLKLGGEYTVKAFLGATLAASFGAMCGPKASGKDEGFYDSEAPLEMSVQKKADAQSSSEAFSTTEGLTPYKDVTTYNNFYEFETDKESPAKLARDFTTSPWEVKVEGEVRKPGVYSLEDLFSGIEKVERIYRLRCVEAWSMVIPWTGYELGKLIKKLEPTSKARYVELTTVYRPEEMPGQKRGGLDFPYVEGLRLDEAMHPLTLLVTGLYGKALPGQNGAPVRLVVPWKYGFKNVKSIVKIRLTKEMPKTTWALANPREYGFFANVNPNVDHPRWSQAKERRIGEFKKRKTLMFNGYAEHVAHLYRGVDLQKYF